MRTPFPDDDSRLSLWSRVRRYAVPATMIETATARRAVGDWAGACTAAHLDVDLDLRSVARSYGKELASRIRADLRHLAPDLLRWHMPRVAPDGLLRPGLTLALARYEAPGRDGPRPVHLVVRTAPAWADAGQRMSLALWDGSRPDAGARRHPHPRPHPRFRLDLHRHLWDARRTDELRTRAGAVGERSASGRPTCPDPRDPGPPGGVPPKVPARSVRHPLEGSPDVLPLDAPCAVDRWTAEAAILLRAEGRPDAGGRVAVRVGRHRLVLDLGPDGDGSGSERPSAPRGGPVVARAPSDGTAGALPVLPDAATWLLPDLELLRADAIEAGELHPLVASALLPDRSPHGRSRAPAPEPAGRPHLVECRGAEHRIGLVDGVLAPLDHDPAEVRREELLVALTGTPLPCLRAIDEAHRNPHCLSGVRERLDHGDTAGALAIVEALLGPEATLRNGALRDALEAAARRRLTYGLFRAGLVGPAPGRLGRGPRRPRDHRSRPRHTAGR
ncbi:hypothetical protein EAO71_35620 [Streptomyces sp. ms191]|uniref:hypothetical protein n=1 Tax=Streptomyces sp. ms191 TaxID=1827978 RepID=UPI0011CEA808|nr:hypothetical protein [Streptomyces sp. ms191]TXS15117.1 hypothetical protein EAO71_35620 [Streptomyces sp. ms191]